METCFCASLHGQTQSHRDEGSLFGLRDHEISNAVCDHGPCFGFGDGLCPYCGFSGDLCCGCGVYCLCSCCAAGSSRGFGSCDFFSCLSGFLGFCFGNETSGCCCQKSEGKISLML